MPPEKLVLLPMRRLRLRIKGLRSPRSSTDRASHFECEGCRFESYRGRQDQLLRCGSALLWSCLPKLSSDRQVVLPERLAVSAGLSLLLLGSVAAIR